MATHIDANMEWFDVVANLQTGEACLFAPAIVGTAESNKLIRLGRGYMKVMTRPRLTDDGLGVRSILA